MTPSNDTPLWSRTDPDDGLSVIVTRTPIGTYRVIFTDTDANETIDSRVYVTRESADLFASTLIPEIQQ
jgi:hypothetical protein